MIIPVILSGGAGKRLWPLSRESHPKQFLPLFDGRSLFNLTLERVQAEGFAAPLVICNTALWPRSSWGILKAGSSLSRVRATQQQQWQSLRWLQILTIFYWCCRLIICSQTGMLSAP